VKVLLSLARMIVSPSIVMIELPIRGDMLVGRAEIHAVIDHAVEIRIMNLKIFVLEETPASYPQA
jgi:hypothetical protein